MRTLLEAKPRPAIRRALRDVVRNERRALDVIRPALRDLQRQLRAVISELEAVTPVNMAPLQQALAAIVGRSFAALVNRLRPLAFDAFRAGVALADGQLGDYHHKLPLPMVEAVEPAVGLQTLADTAWAFAATQITAVGDDTRARISTLVARASLGQVSTQDVLHDIAANLDDSLIFRTITDRAETIARTEMNRIYSMATYARLGQASEFVPGLGKEWVATLDGRTRPDHMAAHGQAVDWDKPFIVGDEELRYPRDPAGSAGQTVNCRCVAVPVVP